MPGKAKRKKGSPPTVYWDTCVLLAWIKDEKRSAGQMENLHNVVTELHEGRMNMITAVTFTGESWESRLSDDARDKLEGLFNRSNIELVNIDERIGRLQSEIMEHYKAESKRDDRPPLCFADAQHLAAAIVYKVDEFHTFDLNDNKHCRGLLGLTGDVAGHGLTVCMPKTVQMGLL